jgi:hypothetical protein
MRTAETLAQTIRRVKWERDRLRETNERLNMALDEIRSWAKAYPLEIFPEYDFKEAHKVLVTHGMTLDAISAHAMRHVLKGVIQIIDGALTEETSNA